MIKIHLLTAKIEDIGKLELAANQLLSQRDSPYDTTELATSGNTIILKISLKDTTINGTPQPPRTYQYTTLTHHQPPKKDPNNAGGAWKNEIKGKPFVNVKLDHAPQAKIFQPLSEFEKHDMIFKRNEKNEADEDVIITYQLAPNLFKEEGDKRPDWRVVKIKEE